MIFLSKTLHSTCFIHFAAQMPALWSPTDLQSQHLGAIWLSLRSRQLPPCLTKPPGAGLTYASGRRISTRNSKAGFGSCEKYGSLSEGQVQFYLKIKKSVCRRQARAHPYGLPLTHVMISKFLGGKSPSLSKFPQDVLRTHITFLFQFHHPSLVRGKLRNAVKPSDLAKIDG